MTVAQRVARAAAATAVLTMAAACGSTGSLGNILGGVLAPTSNQMQMSGTVQGVDTRSQVVSIQQSAGQTVAVNYDNRTKVVYQNQLYSVTSLEFGDRVIARLTDQGNNTYYTDSIYVSQPVNGSTSGTINNCANVQTLTGTVRSVDRSNGWFTIDANSGVSLTVSMPYNANSQDVNRFNNLRIGDYVRFYGVFVNNSRVELRQFY
jgi:hypothetical protein